MKFTDLFVNRPVLAIVVSLLVLVLGVRAVTSLTVREYPETENATVTVTTAYYGADAETMAGFVTQPLEQAIAQAQGIDYLSSSSVAGVSTITATLRLNYDANRALTDITTQINSVRNQLPPQAQQPVLKVQTGQTIDAMYMGFYSDVLPTNKITDYLARVVKPKLDSIAGVQTAEILGGRQFALRAWLDPARMAAHSVTATDVSAALAANNYLAAVGATKGQAVTVPLTADTDLHTVKQFKQLAIKHENGTIVRLKDVANVTLGSESYDTSVAFSGKQSVFIGVKVAPRRQHPVGGPARAHGVPRYPDPVAHGHHRSGGLRRDHVREHLDPRSHKDPGRGAADCCPGDLPVPRQSARRDHPAGGDAAVADRHVFRDAGAGLLDQPAHTAGAGAGHRTGSGRCHHRGGTRRPAHQGRRQDPAAGGTAGRARVGRPDPGDGRGADRGLCADRIPAGPDRRPVLRVRVHASGCSDRIGDHCTDPVASDVRSFFPGTAGGRRGRRVERRSFRYLHRPSVRKRAPALPAPLARRAVDLGGHCAHGRPAVTGHDRARHDRQQ